MTINWPLPQTASEFEDFCCTFLQHAHKLDHVQRFGRSGQKQHGIDLLGSGNGGKVAAQCKLRLGGTLPSIRELESDINAATKAFSDLTCLYIFISTDRDSALADHIVSLSVDRESAGMFRVHVYFWPDIASHARSNSVLYDSLRSQLFPHEMSNERQTDVILHALRTSLDGLKSTRSAGVVDSDIDKQIDAIWRRVDEGKLPYALEAYMGIQQDQWDDLTEKQKYRVLGNIGSIHKLLGDYATAARYYHQAASHYDSQASRLLDAMGYWFEDNRQKAFEIAIAECGKEPPSARAHMIRLRTQDPIPGLIQAVQSVPAEIANDIEILSVFHATAMDDRNFAEAELYARKIVEASPEWVDGQLMLCRVLLRRVQDNRLATGMPLTDISTLPLVDECGRLANKVLADAALLGSDRADAAHICATLDLLAGNDEGHFRYLRMAQQIDPGDIPSACSLAHAEADRGHFQNGVDLLEIVPVDSRSLFWARSYAECLRGLGPTRYREALDAMLDYLDELNDVPIGVALDYLQRARRLAIYLDAGDELVERLEAAPLLAPVIREITLAVIAFEMNDSEKADLHINRAMACLPPDAGRIEREMLAKGLGKLGRFEQAAEIVLPLVREDIFEDSERLYLGALQQAKRLKPLLAHCRASKAAGIWSKELLGFMVDALLEIPSPNQASAELAAWVADHPQDKRMRLQLGIAQCMAGQAERVNIDLNKLPQADTCTPGDGLQVVQLLLNAVPANPTAARDYAYLLWRRHSNEKDACKALIVSLFHSAGRNDEYQPPAAVAKDTAVSVKTQTGEIETYVIETGPAPRSEYDEIAPDHPIAMALIGRCEGDQVDLPASGLPRRATIVAIHHKVVFRSNSLGNTWQRKWPNDSFLRPVSGATAKESVDEFLAFATSTLQAEQSHRAVVYEHYVGQQASVHMFARATGTSACMAILKLAGTPKHIILACSGSTTDQRQASATLTSCETVVLDSTALAAALAVTDVTTILQALPMALATPDFVLVDLRETLDRLHDTEGASGSVGLDDAGQIRIYEYSSDHVSKDQEHLRRSESAIMQRIKPADSEIVLELIDGIERTNAQKVLGSSLHAISLAKALGGALWTDDLVTSQIARSHGVPSVWSAAVLAHLRDTGLLAAEVVERALATMYLAGWRAPHLSTSTLIQAFRDSEWKLDDQRLCDLFEVFSDSSVRIGSLSNILVGLCQYLEGGPDKARLDHVLDFILPILDRHPEGRLGIERAATILKNDNNALVSSTAAMKIEFWLAKAPPRIIAQPKRLWLPPWMR